MDLPPNSEREFVSIMTRSGTLLLMSLSALMMVNGLHGQSDKIADIKTVAAAGRLDGTVYKNDYFRLTVQLLESHTYFKVKPSVGQDRAMLVLDVNNAEGTASWDPLQRHNFAVIAQLRSPTKHTVTEFVENARKEHEQEGFKIVRAKFPIKIAGRDFIESDLRMESPNPHYKAILCTTVRGYFLGFWVEAANEEQLKKLTNLGNRVTFR